MKDINLDQKTIDRVTKFITDVENYRRTLVDPDDETKGMFAFAPGVEYAWNNINNSRKENFPTDVFKKILSFGEALDSIEEKMYENNTVAETEQDYKTLYENVSEFMENMDTLSLLLGYWFCVASTNATSLKAIQSELLSLAKKHNQIQE